MKIMANPYRGVPQTAQKSQTGETPADGSEKVENKDTFTISLGGEKITARKINSRTDMLSMKISGEDFEKFRNAVSSKNKFKASVDVSTIDSTRAIREAYFIESTINQLNDPNGAKNAFERDRIANAYAQSKIDALVEQKKAAIGSDPADYFAREYEEYQRAYDAYHSGDSSIIANMTGDERKAYDIYSAIISGNKYTVKDEEFLTLHNSTMFRAARLEFQKLQEERLGIK